ncbi:MAG: hypothetical protein AAFR58_16025 [Cyanobacteria bacterium J06627_28]
MKPLKNAEFTQSAPTNYAPSVPMSVYRELAAELRANKAVIDSLNSRNQQLIQQNQRLKKEIHNVVQATLNLGQFAGVARPAGQDSVPNAIGPDTLAKLVRAQGEANKTAGTIPIAEPDAINYDMSPQHPPAAQPPQNRQQQGMPQTRPTQHAQPPQQRRPQPIQPGTRPSAPTNAPTQKRAGKPAGKPTARPVGKQLKNNRPPAPPRQTTAKKRIDVAMTTKATPTKLFTEQTGEYRSSVLDSQDEKEIGGIWLALSIILIIVTAFGAGFLIMKPLLNDR